MFRCTKHNRVQYDKINKPGKEERNTELCGLYKDREGKEKEEKGGKGNERKVEKVLLSFWSFALCVGI